MNISVRNRTRGFRFIAAAFVLLILTEIAVLGQSRARIVSSPSCPYLDDSVVLEISGLRTGDKEVSFDVPFAAGDDWLAGMVFRLINKGRKPIAGIVLTVGLLEGVDEKLPSHASYEYGLQFIRVNAGTAKKGRLKPGVLLPPGKEIEITTEGSRPYGLRHMDAVLQGTTRADNWASFASKVGARFHRMEVMSADIWFLDGSKGDAELLVSAMCDQKK